MRTIRKRHDGKFKCKVVVEAVKGQRTLSEIASDYGVHPNQITKWKKQALDGLPDIFSDKRKKNDREAQELQDELYRQIGQLKVELDWLKKKSGLVG